MIRVHSWERTLRLAALVAGDAAIAALAVVASVRFRREVAIPWTEGLLPAEKFPLDLVNVGIAMITLILCLGATGFYAQRVTARHRPMLTAALAAQVALLALVSTLLQRPYPRTILLAQPLLEAGLLVGWRRLFAAVLPVRARHAVVVGSRSDVEQFLSILAPQLDARVAVSGWISTDGTRATFVSAPCLADLGDATAAQLIREADELIVVAADPHLRLRLFELRGPIGYLAVPTHADALLVHPHFAWIGDQPLVEIAARSALGFGQTVKRTADFVLACLLLVLLSPLMLAIAIAIVLETGLPVLHLQSRCGLGGVRFRMLKFRTMRRGNLENGQLAVDADARVTRVGRWLRRYRLDELPQLVNVLRGDMSLVGPRPEQIEIHEKLSRDLDGFALRLLVRPGATGLAQISADYESAASTKLRYDLSYICAWSVWLDLRILLLSVSTSLSGRGL